MELKPSGSEGEVVEVRVVTETTIRTEGPLRPTMEVRRALQAEPNATPVMYQTWSDILFLHWEWDPVEIQKTLPPGLFVDTHGEKAYVAITPFFMNDVRASFLPEIPGTANFLELNVRTYVHDARGIPGIWFYSLDCNQGLAVMMAKFFYSLPYYGAMMEAREQAGLFEYKCQRQGEKESAQFNYRKEDKSVGAAPGSLAYFLAERYLLYSYSQRNGKLYRARVHHAPWQLSHAYLGKYDETMLRINGLNPKLRGPDHRWMGGRKRVKIYGLEEAG